jgi:5-methylcytosine-specific restriction endonuclease McrA
VTRARIGICRDCRRRATSGAYCDVHQTDNRAASAVRERERERRESGLKKLYDSAQWRRRTQPNVLRRDALCTIGIRCFGRALSTDVDHVIKAEIFIEQHGGDETSFFDEDNLRGACHACHAYKTARERAGRWSEAEVLAVQ